MIVVIFLIILYYIYQNIQDEQMPLKEEDNIPKDNIELNQTNNMSPEVIKKENNIINKDNETRDPMLESLLDSLSFLDNKSDDNTNLSI